MSERLRKLQELKEKFSAVHEELKIKRCSLDNCIETPIKAHTIQERGALKYLAGIGEKNLEGVYYLDDTVKYDFENLKITSIQALNKLDFKAISTASTFYGFCKRHDEIFNKEIENVIYDGSDRMSFYHTFRTQACSLHKTSDILEHLNKVILAELQKLPANLSPLKEQMHKINSSLNGIPDAYVLTNEQVEDFRGKFEALGDTDFSTNGKIKKEMASFFTAFFSTGQVTGKYLKNLPNSLLNFLNTKFSELMSLESLLVSSIPQALQELLNTRTRLSRSFENKTYNDFVYFSHSLKGIFPLAGAFVAGYLDHIISPDDDGSVMMPKYAVTFFPEPSLNRTTFIFGSFNENRNVSILYSKLRIKSDSEFGKFMSDLILNRGSNTYFSPRLWNKLSHAEREIIIQRKERRKDTDFGLYDLGLNIFDPRFIDTPI